MSKKLNKQQLQRLRQLSNDIRVDVITMLGNAKSGHPGGSLSIVELIVALFYCIMNIDSNNPEWEERDRFHLSKGHGCPALYAVLARLGYFPIEEFNNLRQLGGLLQGHPHPRTPGIEVASGSLGQGLSVACGMALADRLDKKNSSVYVLLGDGELQEGQVWEAAMLASHYNLDNLYVIIDYNGMQIDGKIEVVMDVQPLIKKFDAFGFHVSEVDGHNIERIVKVIESAQKVKGKPKVIIARTIKGKGVSFMEHNLDFHGRAPNNDETDKALTELKEFGTYD